MATTEAKYNRQSSYNFCSECNGNHPDDPQYPGRKNKEAAQLGRRYMYVQGVVGVRAAPRDGVPCQCCQVIVNRESVNQMAYVCGHTKTFCLTCATHHLNCQDDHAVLKMGSYESLVRRL